MIQPPQVVQALGDALVRRGIDFSPDFQGFKGERLGFGQLTPRLEDAGQFGQRSGGAWVPGGQRLAMQVSRFSKQLLGLRQLRQVGVIEQAWFRSLPALRQGRHCRVETTCEQVRAIHGTSARQRSAGSAP